MLTFLPQPKHACPWPQLSFCNVTLVFRIEKLLKFLIFCRRKRSCHHDPISAKRVLN